MSDHVEPMEPTEPTEVRGTPADLSLGSATSPLRSDAAQSDLLAALPLVLAVAAALMLLGAILFALASASTSAVGSADRFRLLGAAAHPVTALTALAALAILTEDRRRGTDRALVAPVASGIATAVSLAVVLLGINGVLTDLTGDAGALFRISSLITRLAPIGVAAAALWLSLRSAPPARARRRTPTAGGG